MEIDDKGGEIVQRYEAWLNGGENVQWKRWDTKEIEGGHGQRGSNIGEKNGSQVLDKRSTQVGGASSWTLIAFDMCIFMCLLALHKFLNLICMFVWCMLVVELEWWFDN